MSALDNSVIIKGSKSGITVFLDNEMPFEELLESVSDKFKNASKFFNNANMAISFDGRDLSAEEEKKILNIISDVSDLNIVCVLDENNDIYTIHELNGNIIRQLSLGELIDLYNNAVKNNTLSYKTFTEAAPDPSEPAIASTWSRSCPGRLRSRESRAARPPSPPRASASAPRPSMRSTHRPVRMR